MWGEWWSSMGCSSVSLSVNFNFFEELFIDFLTLIGKTDRALPKTKLYYTDPRYSIIISYLGSRVCAPMNTRDFLHTRYFFLEKNTCSPQVFQGINGIFAQKSEKSVIFFNKTKVIVFLCIHFWKSFFETQETIFHVNNGNVFRLCNFLGLNITWNRIINEKFTIFEQNLD